MKRLSEKRKLAGEITISLIAGMFSIVPVACGAPVLDKVVSGGATVTVADKVTDVSSSAQNNVIDWKDFSVSNGETVQFDSGAKTHNYLNIVTGAATSQIDGAIEGGKNVYIVNPNGVIFGKGASVDVGNLYVSTRSVSAVDLTGIDSTTGDMSPLATAAAANADVVNLGKLQATKVQVEGASIRFLNTTDITADKVAMTANTDGYIHVGYDDKDKKATASYTAGTNSNGNSVAIEDYQLIKTTSDLVTAATAVNAGGTANYMLYNDLDMKGVTGFTPIGTSTNPFKNKFDGMFYAIENLTLDNTANKSQATGLFGVVKGDNYQSSPARIDNVGLVKPNITGGDEAYTGGLAGQATNVVFHNVYTEDGSISNGSEIGGLVGLIGNVDKSAGSTAALIDGAYNIGTTSTGGGLVGVSEYDVSIKNTYSQGRNGSTTHKGLVDGVDVSLGTGALTVENSYTTYNSLLSNGVGATDSYAAATSKSASTYSGFDISNDGTKKSVWRIYEGQTLPMLTAFMQGNAVVNYDYTHGTDTGSNGGSAVSTTYNAQDFAVKNASYYGVNDSSSITQATDGLHNAMDKKAIFYSTQHGYNLIGDNLTINKKSLSITGGDTVTVTKIYDGTKSANAAVAATLGVYDADKDNVTLSGLTVEFGSKNVGTYSSENTDPLTKITATGDATLTGSAAANYTLDASSLSTLKYTGTITPRTLYLKLNTSSGLDKTYDGTSALDSTKTDWAAASNVVIDDTKGTDHQLVSTSSETSGSVKDDAALSFTNATANYVGTDGSAISHAGSHAVRYSGITLSGKDATNYQLVGTAGGAETIGTIDGSGTINRRVINKDSFKVLNSDGTTAVGTKVYDGLTSYDATGKTLTSDVSATGNTGVIDADRANVIFTPTGSGTFTQSDGTTATANVSDAKKIAYGVTVSGDADTISNYKLGTDDLTKGENYTVTGDGTITPRAINISLSNAKDINKVYDGKDTVTGTGTAGSYTAFGNYVNYSSGSTSATELTGNDSAKWNITAKYDGADVARTDGTVKANGKGVTYTVTIDNANGNYTLNGNTTGAATLTGATGMITPLGVTVSFNDLTKTYDGTTTVIGKVNETITPTISGALATDTVSLADGYTAAYNSPNVKTATTITYGNLSLTGAKAGNYDLNSTTVTGNGKINPKNLALTYTYDSDLLTKTYDNTVDIDNTAAAAHLKGITVDGVTVDGNPATVTYSVDHAVYSDKNSKGNATQDVNYTISIKGASGDEADNYTYGSSFTKSGDHYIVTNTNTNGGQILQKDVQAVVTDFTPKRAYDADTDIAETGDKLITLTGLVSGDGTTNASTAVYTDKNASSQDAVGTYLTDKSVKYTVALGNNSGDNYRLVDATNNVLTTPLTVANKGIITKRALTVDFAKATKVYDKTAAVNKTTDTAAGTDDTIRYTLDDGKSGAILTKDGLKTTTGLDTTKITGTYGTLAGTTFSANENAGTRTVQYTGLSDALQGLGTAASNYTLSTTAYGAGEIERKTIKAGDFAVTAGTVVNVYHGDTSVLNPENYITVKFGSDSLAYSDTKKEYTLTAAYTNKNVGNRDVNYTITVDQSTLGGNYILEGSSVSLNGTAAGQITPKEITVGYTGDAITKVYNGKTDLVKNTQADVTGTALDISGSINAADGSFYTNDDVTLDKSALNAHYADANAGQNKTVEYTVKLTGGDSSNYVLKTLGTQGTITPKEVTASFGDVTKVYDATTSVPSANIKPTVDGILSTDSSKGISVTVGSAVYNSPNVKEANTITYDGLALTNADGNYTLVATKTTGSGTITPLALQAGDIKTQFDTITKVYDGNKNVVDPTQHFTITGKGITINYMLDETDGAVYNDKNVGSGKNVTYKVSGISALDSDNFTLDSKVVIGGTYTTTGSITPKAIKAHVAQTANVSKIYDGTTAASKDNLVIDDGILSGDTGVVTLDWTAAYNNKNASSDPNVATNNRNVTYTLTLSGNDAGNYTLDAAAHPAKGSATETSGSTYQATGDIRRRLVYADFVNGSSSGMDKVYDGGAAVAQAYRDRVGLAAADTAAQTGIIDNDVQLSGFTSSYDSKDVNRDSNGRVIDRKVQFTGFTLEDKNKTDGSDDAANYIVKAADGTTTLTGTGTISPRTINVAVKDGPIKEYDGTTAVVGNTYATAANINVDRTNLVAGDTINVGLESAPSYQNKNAGKGITYTYDLNWDNGNYELAADKAAAGQSLSSEGFGQSGKLTAGLTGTDGVITPRVLTVDAVKEADKVYDGTTGVENAAANIVLNNRIISGDTIGLSADAAYDNANASGSEASDTLLQHTVDYKLTLSNGNYQLSDDTAQGKGTIHRKGLDVVADSVTVDAGDALPAFHGHVDGLVPADSSLAGQVDFRSDVTATSVPGEYAVYGWYSDRTSGNLGQNYTFNQNPGNEKAFTVRLTKPDRGYFDTVNPKTQFTPDRTAYYQASKDGISGFNGKPEAALEYRDSRGNVMSAPAVIPDGGTITGSLTNNATKPGQIGISKGNVVNLSSADVANAASIEVDGSGTVVNLEIVPITAGSSGPAASAAIENVQ